MGFQHQYPLDERTYIEVQREQSGDSWDARIMLTLYVNENPDTNPVEVARMTLRSLEPLLAEGFAENDFVQHGLKSVQPGKGYAHRLHDFLIQNRAVFPFEIHNVYSTEPGIDNIYFVQRNQPRLYISASAVTFWKKRVNSDKAEYIEKLKRYRVKW